jgi:GT2 family glycosyltransferase
MSECLDKYYMIGVTLMEKIFVIIPNWNGADLITKSLESLQNQIMPVTTVVVDNGSTDDSVRIIKTEFPAVQLIELSHNTGFAGGVNAGIKYALGQGASAIALLNNDAVADKYWIQKLADRLRKNDNLGIVTSKIVRADKKHLDSTGDFYTSWGTAFPRGRDQEDIGQFDVPEEVFSASGGASLYRSKVFQDTGLFDEDFFAYYEDVDLSFRARLYGWKVFYEPTSVVYHEVGATSSRIHDFGTYHGLKNIFFLSYKNLPLSLLIWQFPKRALYYTALHARAWTMGKPLASLKAIGKVLVLLPKKTVERWSIQRSKKLKTADLDKMIHHSLPPSTKRKLGKL